MKQLELTPRLRAVAELVPNGAALADVGTDHAYLPVWLLQQNKICRAIASDLRVGPLQRAKRTAEQYGCTDRIEFILCDGLADIGMEQVDTVVIAGMGGESICSILENALWLANPNYTLVLQPMSAQPELRRWMWQHGFRIERERIECEGKRLYNILLVKYGGAKKLTLAEEWAGCQTQALSQPLRGIYLQKLLDKLRKALDGISRGMSGTDTHAEEFQQAFEELIEMKKEWDAWQR